MKDYNFGNYCDELIENEIATEEEINLVSEVCGHTTDTLDRILYARTAYSDWEQYCHESKIKNVFEDDEDDFDVELTDEENIYNWLYNDED